MRSRWTSVWRQRRPCSTTRWFFSTATTPSAHFEPMDERSNSSKTSIAIASRFLPSAQARSCLTPADSTRHRRTVSLTRDSSSRPTRVRGRTTSSPPSPNIGTSREKPIRRACEHARRGQHVTEETRPMAEATTFHDAFIDELRDTYDAEKQLTKALPKLAKASSNPKLRDAFESHLEETQGQIARLEQVFESLDEKVRGKHCDGIAGIIQEGKSIMEEDFDDTTMDACLIAAGQRAEHYEMAAYGTLIAWSEAMGHSEATRLLQQNLNEEKAADKKLSSLAEGGINQSAAQAAHPAEDEEEM